MEVRFIQKGIGWCAVYTWANLLNDPGPLNLCNDERFKGITDKEEQEILDIYYPYARIKEIAYINPAYGYVPSGLIWDIVTKPDEQQVFEDQVMIHLMSVRLIESMHHYVATATHKGNVWYLDPMQSHWLQVKEAEGFESLFIDCCCVSRPVSLDENKYMSFDGSYFKYPFLESELTTV